MVNNIEKADFSSLRDAYRGPYVPRNWKRWGDFIPYSPRTIANYDCQGTGPAKRVLVGKVTCYEKESLIEWLEEHSKIIE